MQAQSTSSVVGHCVLLYCGWLYIKVLFVLEVVLFVLVELLLWRYNRFCSVINSFTELFKEYFQRICVRVSMIDNLTTSGEVHYQFVRGLRVVDWAEYLKTLKSSRISFCCLFFRYSCGVERIGDPTEEESEEYEEDWDKSVYSEESDGGNVDAN